ncbi:hypothetical protein L6R49_29520 [Myxococcota bacterium]|nr:hypothetical protein [Myxococcota bacterium]
MSPALWLLLTTGALAQEAPATLTLALVTAREGLNVEAQGVVLGEARAVPLRDDGQGPDERADDGVYTGALVHDGARVLSLRLAHRAPDGAEETLWEGLERVYSPEDRWVFRLDDGAPRARRVAAPPLPPETPDLGAAPTAASLAWAGLVLLYVSTLLRRGGEGPP